MSWIRRQMREVIYRMSRLEQEMENMSVTSEKVLAEAIETQGKVDTMVVVLEAVRTELEAIKNQSDPHLIEAIAILDGVQAKVDEVVGPEEPPFEPSGN